jgi:hypothetical protein
VSTVSVEVTNKEHISLNIRRHFKEGYNGFFLRGGSM